MSFLDDQDWHPNQRQMESVSEVIYCTRFCLDSENSGQLFDASLEATAA
jgi:hypothetical protein